MLIVESWLNRETNRRHATMVVVRTTSGITTYAWAILFVGTKSKRDMNTIEQTTAKTRALKTI